jgi:hypothetical protein
MFAYGSTLTDITPDKSARPKRYELKTGMIGYSSEISTQGH